jgi:predicted site-specific integrase-resolvase
MENYKTPKEASKILGVHWQTLRNWDANGTIETKRMPGGKRLYNVNKYLEENNLLSKNTKKNICYCRVSSIEHKTELQRQKDLMKKLYPDYEIIEDVSEGLNYNRPGLNKILKFALDKDINELVITHKDILCSFGFVLIENIIKESSNGKITVVNILETSSQEELTKDIVNIMNIFNTKLNSLQKHIH